MAGAWVGVPVLARASERRGTPQEGDQQHARAPHGARAESFSAAGQSQDAGAKSREQNPNVITENAE